MKFAEIPAPKLILRVHPLDSKISISSFPLFVRSVKTETLPEASFSIGTPMGAVLVRPDSEMDSRRLRDELSMARSAFGQIDNPDASGGFELHLVLFPFSMGEIGLVEVELDSVADRSVASSGLISSKKSENEDDPYRGLSEFFCFTPDIPSDTSDTHEAESILFVKTFSEAESESGEYFEGLPPPSMLVVGDGCRFAAKMENRVDSDNHPISFLSASKFTTRIPRDEETNLRPLRGRLSFVKRASRIQALARAQFNRLIQSSSSYLHQWDDYNKLEEDSTLNDARVFGVASFCNAEIYPGNNTKVTLSGLTPEAYRVLKTREKKDLEIVATPPIWIDDPNLSVDAILEYRREKKSKSESSSEASLAT